MKSAFLKIDSENELPRFFVSLILILNWLSVIIKGAMLNWITAYFKFLDPRINKGYPQFMKMLRLQN